MRIFTIGHSTKPLEQLLAELKAHGVELLVDVRSFPASRRYPHFNSESLETSVPAAGIEYRPMQALGGRRKTRADSPNMGWRNASFRGYADYMGTPQFREALQELQSLARTKTTAIMCAEAVPWRCHRSLIADALVTDGWEVLNIFDETTLKPHVLNPMAKVQNDILTYPLTTHQEPLL